MPAGKEENNIESKYEQSQISQPAPSQPAASVKIESSGEMNSAVAEIKKLSEQLSQMRQENIVLKEETLRLKRIAAASEKPHDTPSYSSTTVTAVSWATCSKHGIFFPECFSCYLMSFKTQSPSHRL